MSYERRSQTGPGSLAEAIIQRVHRRARSLLDAHETCLMAVTEPHLHELRLAARHLEAALEVCRAWKSEDKDLRRARKSVRWIISHTGALRDLHVHRIIVETTWKVDGMKHAVVRVIIGELLAREKTVRKQLQRMDTGPLKHLMTWTLPGPDRKGAPQALTATLNRCRKRLQRRVAKLRAGDTRSLHRVRVALKRYRYVIEAFAEHLPDLRSIRRALMDRHQKRLGHWHDEDALADWLLEHGDLLAKPWRAPCKAVAGRMSQGCADEERRLIAVLAKAYP